MDLEGWYFIYSYKLDAQILLMFRILLNYILSNICRGSHLAIITNTTVEVVVPRSVVPAIYGEDGGCLKRIREVFFRLMIVFTVLSSLG